MIRCTIKALEIDFFITIEGNLEIITSKLDTLERSLFRMKKWKGDLLQGTQPKIYPYRFFWALYKQTSHKQHPGGGHLVWKGTGMCGPKNKKWPTHMGFEPLLHPLLQIFKVK